MSLLEDVFLENEAGEAQELERIIEGDDFDERPRSRSDSDENSAKEDEAEEDKRRVDPTSTKPKRVIKNPRFVLNPARLTGPRGIQVIPEHFKDFKFKGKGHEREDLDLVLKKLEHWAYRLYPKFQFEDCLKKIETLGKKKAVSVHLHRIRFDQISSEETVVQKDSSDDEATSAQQPEEDEFDKLLQQQIEIARATPGPGSVKKTPFSDRSSLMPKATSSPSINDEQRERMLKNRRMAEERRLARLKQNTSQDNLPENTAKIIDVSKETRNKSVLESSDDEGNKSLTKKGNKSDIVELDDDGIVTKSPGSYIPAKKHKSKLNLSNSVSESVTIEVNSNTSDIVELDNDGKVVTNSPKIYETAKKRKKTRIHSSDDNADVINEFDDEKHKNSRTKTNSAKERKSGSDSSDTEVVSESVTMEVEHHHYKVKHNRSNIIDSSDSEDDALIMNESITVDIHDGNKLDRNESNKSVNGNITDTIKNTIFDGIKASNTNELIVGNIEIQSDLENKEDLSNVSDNDNCNKVPNVTEIVTNVSETRKTIENAEISKNDEIMDVDFSDDF